MPGNTGVPLEVLTCVLAAPVFFGAVLRYGAAFIVWGAAVTKYRREHATPRDA
ncbi:MAG: hypothetical protein JO330_12650 [Mycobacteriaceae bacterium]|nr:hypothetical protein [Mycobacteriaceae bacterium]